MKKNFIYFTAVIILSVIAIVLIFSRTKNTFDRESSEFAVDDTASITKIFMADKNNNTLTLTRNENGGWSVNNQYEAHRYNLQMLLSTLISLEVKSPVARAARENIVKDLATNGVKVEIYQMKYRVDLLNIRLFPHEKLTKVYYVGPATQDNRGTFMIMENSDVPFIVYMPELRGFVSSRYTPIEKYWRDYSIFRKTIPEIESVVMEYPAFPGESFEVVRNGKGFTINSLAPKQPLPAFDTVKLMNFLNGFRSLNFEMIINDMDETRKDSLLKSQPFCVISVTDTAGQTRKVTAFRKAAAPGVVDDKGKPLPFDLDRLYVLANEGKDLTLAQYFVMDKVLRPKSWFIPNKTGEKD